MADLNDMFELDGELKMPVSDYVDSATVTVADSNKYEYKIFHANIQSLPSKSTDIRLMLQELKNNNIVFDFILLCETWLRNFNKTKYALQNYAIETKCRETYSRGGVAIYIKKPIQYSVREDLSVFVEGEFESLFIEIPSKHLIIGEIYRVPKSSNNPYNFIEQYETIVKTIRSENKKN